MRCWALVVVAMLASGPAEAAYPDAADAYGSGSTANASSSDLADAKRFADEYLFEEALAAVDKAIQRGGLTEKEHARALQLRGLALAALTRTEEAQRTFERWLEVEPGARIDPTLGPRIRAPFYDAQAAWKKRRAPEVRLRWPAGGQLTVRYESALAGPRHVRVELRSDKGSEPSMDANAAKRKAAIDVPPSAIWIAITITDDRKNVIFQREEELANIERVREQSPSVPAPSASPLMPPSPKATPPPDESSWLEHPLTWIITGVVVAGGVTTGIVVASQ